MTRESKREASWRGDRGSWRNEPRRAAGDHRRHSRGRSPLRPKIARAVACTVALGICLALALVVGSDEYRPTAVGWVPFIAVASAIVVAFLYVQVLKRSLRLLEKTNMTECTRNERVNFVVRFSNRSPLFFFRIEAHFFTADLSGAPINHVATTLALAPFEKYDLPFATSFEHIGTFQAGLERVVVYDFLRLFSVTLPGPGRVRVHVAPRLVTVPRVDFSNEASVEAAKAARAVFSDAMDYAGVREYQWGDPLKSIHWKLSARTPTYMTRLFEMFTNPGVSIVLDFYGPALDAFELMALFDCVVETGFSVARYAQMQGLDTEVHYCNRSGYHKRQVTWRKSDLPQIVSDMPRFSSDPKRASDALRVLQEEIRGTHGQNNVAVCTANVSAEMVETIVEAKGYKRHPVLFAVIPRRLEGRERDRWLAPLARLDAANIGYTVISSSDDLMRKAAR